MIRRALAIASLAALPALSACAPPSPGPFYADAGAGARRPGRLLRAEKLSGGPPDALAWRILYVSTGFDGRPIEVSGVVVAPDFPPPLARRPVVAWAHPTTGVARGCAPSLSDTVFERIPHLDALLALDYVVAATDYPGLGAGGVHPYLVGESEGRAVLDAVRAAGEVEKAGAGRRYVAWGHSQGGQAVLFAGQLAETYAPELSLVGVAAIAPATDLATLLKDDLATRAGRILGSYALWSWSRVYGAPLSPWVTPAHARAIDRVAEDCIETRAEVYGAAFETLPLPGDFVPDAAFDAEPWKRRLESNRPGGALIRRPIYLAQGEEDVIVRPAVTADFYAALCRGGESVRFVTLPGVDHLRAGYASATGAIQWMRDRFDGTPVKNGCPAPAAF